MKTTSRLVGLVDYKEGLFPILLFLSILLPGCKNRYLLKGMGDTYFKGRLTTSINSYPIFSNGIVATGTPLNWDTAKQYDKMQVPDSFAKYFKSNKTVGYLVIKNDSLCFEQYFDGFSDTSHTNSWSMAKSIVSLLAGIAIKEGKIKSANEKVSDFIPSFSKGLDTLLTIKDLLTMSSGIDFGESYISPFGYPAKALYGNNIVWLTLKHHCVIKPGTVFKYQSGNSELLGYIVTKATGQTLTDYASEKLWKPLGATQPGFWSLDHKNGMEKSFCCFNSNARDFARLGKLMLDSGKWNGSQLIPKDYFSQSVKGQIVSYYGYQWWLTNLGKHNIIAAEGFSGQYIIIIPDENMVVVRLGKKFGKDDISNYAGPAILMYGNKSK